ncbi:MAG: hypothetical protein CL610_13465 [Anaerolineaceae bacterium]|nr:hypothetical protein [Anaerolineaceae bacterium]
MPISEAAHHFFDALDSRDLETIAAFLHEDFQVKGNVTRELNRDDFLTLLAAYFRAFPDFDFNFTEADQTGRVVHARYAIAGTHKGRLDLTAFDIEPVMMPSDKAIDLPQSDAELTFDADNRVQTLVLNQAQGADLADLVALLTGEVPLEG